MAGGRNASPPPQPTAKAPAKIAGAKATRITCSPFRVEAQRARSNNVLPLSGSAHTAQMFHIVRGDDDRRTLSFVFQGLCTQNHIRIRTLVRRGLLASYTQFAPQRRRDAHGLRIQREVSDFRGQFIQTLNALVPFSPQQTASQLVVTDLGNHDLISLIEKTLHPKTARSGSASVTSLRHERKHSRVQEYRPLHGNNFRPEGRCASKSRINSSSSAVVSSPSAASSSLHARRSASAPAFGCRLPRSGAAFPRGVRLTTEGPGVGMSERTGALLEASRTRISARQDGDRLTAPVLP